MVAGWRVFKTPQNTLVPLQNHHIDIDTGNIIDGAVGVKPPEVVFKF